MIFTEVGLALIETARGGRDRRDPASLLLMSCAFGAAWWWLASYDAGSAGCAAGCGGDGWALAGARWDIWWRARRPLRPAYQGVLVVALAALALPAMSKAVMFKRAMVRDPLMATRNGTRSAWGRL